jgi:hypothetical protein
MMGVSPPDPQGPSPFESLIDAKELKRLEEVSPGSAALVLGMIKSDMEWQAKRTELQDTRDHSARILSIWLTMIVVLSIAGMATWVILSGHGVAGSILATVDLVALATVFTNAWRRNPAPTTNKLTTG